MRRAAASSDGQASVELVALLPMVALVGLVAWQIAVAGSAMWLVSGAARAAARAQAVGRDAGAAARAQLPARLRDGLVVRPRSDGAVSVEVQIPVVVGGGRLPPVQATARFAPQGP